MRENNFPFRHFRDYSAIPDELPRIDTDKILQVDREFSKLKLIVVDDVTGSYRFNPVNRAGMLSYVGLYSYIDEMRRQEARPRAKAIDVLLNHEDKNRQVINKATNLQNSLGHFVFHSMRRLRALDVSISEFSKDFFIRDEQTALHSAEAIAEIGHCMLQPHTGSMPSPTSDNAKYSVELAQTIADYGSYAAVHDSDVLATSDGYALLMFARNEQQRRLTQFRPRFDLTVNEFGYLQSDFDFTEPLSDEQLFAVKFE